MTPPMIGAWTVRIHAVRPFSIHGDQYFELHVDRPEEPGVGIALRVPDHALATPPAPGQVLEIQFLMGQVTAARCVQ